tara:strand:+ start:279 stop:461 length:183 start_codon:yes stop_codon:yes gene_type:complete
MKIVVLYNCLLWHKKKLAGKELNHQLYYNMGRKEERPILRNSGERTLSDEYYVTKHRIPY